MNEFDITSSSRDNACLLVLLAASSNSSSFGYSCTFILLLLAVTTICEHVNLLKRESVIHLQLLWISFICIDILAKSDLIFVNDGM